MPRETEYEERAEETPEANEEQDDGTEASASEGTEASASEGTEASASATGEGREEESGERDARRADEQDEPQARDGHEDKDRLSQTKAAIGEAKSKLKTTSKADKVVVPLVAGAAAGITTYAARRAPDLVRALTQRIENLRTRAGGHEEHVAQPPEQGAEELGGRK